MHTVHFEHFSRPNEQITLNRYLEPEIQPSHIHDFIEIELVISGSGIHQVGDCRIPVRSGDAFLTNIQTPHCFLSDPQVSHFTVQLPILPYFAARRQSRVRAVFPACGRAFI